MMQLERQPFFCQKQHTPVNKASDIRSGSLAIKKNSNEGGENLSASLIRVTPAASDLKTKRLNMSGGRLQNGKQIR